MNQDMSKVPLNVPSNIIEQFAPTGRLRSAVNLGNAALVQRDAASGKLNGVSPALAQELARTLGLELDLVVYNGAADEGLVGVLLRRQLLAHFDRRGCSSSDYLRLMPSFSKRDFGSSLV